MHCDNHTAKEYGKNEHTAQNKMLKIVVNVEKNNDSAIIATSRPSIIASLIFSLFFVSLKVTLLELIV